MKDQYAGDVGDFIKLGLLRALFEGRQLAVNWFLTPDDPATRDGRHVEYLAQENEEIWRNKDPDLYDFFRSMVKSGARSVIEMQKFMYGEGREFYYSPIERASARSVWFASFVHWLTISDCLFVDPDNGISGTAVAPSIKSISVDEVEYLLGTVKTLMIYHHQTRAKGGHLDEIERLGRTLAPDYTYRAACAIRAGRYSPRVFFIIAPDRVIWERAEEFCRKWAGLVTFHRITEPPDNLGLTPGAPAWQRVDELERRGLL